MTKNFQQSLSPADVLNLLEVLNDDAVKTELVWTLGYLLASEANGSTSGEHVLTSELMKRIEVLAISNDEIDDQAKES